MKVVRYGKREWGFLRTDRGDRRKTERFHPAPQAKELMQFSFKRLKRCRSGTGSSV